jgi:hypothetical protein
MRGGEARRTEKGIADEPGRHFLTNAAGNVNAGARARNHAAVGAAVQNRFVEESIAT